MTRPSLNIESENLSHAWMAAVRGIDKGDELIPLVVSITGFDESGLPVEDQRVRRMVDAELSDREANSVATVASTIFPNSLWNPARERELLYSRFLRIKDRVLRAPGKGNHRPNATGTYFTRLVTGGNPTQCEGNQLEFILQAYNGGANHRRSVLQCSIFDAKLDHQAVPRKLFPCLQHLSFVPADGSLCVNAFYASQYLMTKAYGNYVGLCWLGRFVAHELKLRLARVTCFAGCAKREWSRRDCELFTKVNA